uniref:Zinc finger protein ENSP00000328166-like n=1 Tax=Saccoglossus kowalevskii TaxID=10224 RepID=A0ABM0LW40_SACKO|nr:PREDICTED: putative zinc finger protein ENSP00000328166-like [Saccoglossus kowalevskii]
METYQNVCLKLEKEVVHPVSLVDQLQQQSHEAVLINDDMTKIVASVTNANYFQKTWTFTSPGYTSEIVNQLDQLRRQLFLTDVLISVDSQDFPCHKLVLASCSEYFRTMFQMRTGVDKIDLSDISASTMGNLLQFLYSGVVNLDKDNVYPLQAAAEFFKIPTLLKGCSEFVQVHGEKDLIKILHTADGQEIQVESKHEVIKEGVSGLVGEPNVPDPNEIVVPSSKRKTLDNCINNLKRESGILSNTCEICQLSFDSKRSLGKHAIIHSQQKNITCNQCPESFSSVIDLQKHQMIHTGEKRYICQECGKAYVYPKSLKDHMKIHTGNDMYICHECGRSFIRSDYLREHLVTHTGEKPYKCDQCDKSYGYRRDLARHQLVHLDESPFKCKVCGKTFRSQDCFRQHKFTHTGEKPYVCEHCGKSFYYRGDLHRHRRNMHPIFTAIKGNKRSVVLSATKETKHYKCEECGLIFSRLDSLQGHLHKHTGEKQFGCDSCGKHYAYKRDLRRHQASHHPELDPLHQ